MSTASAPPLPEPGLIVLFGSGETSPTGRKVFDQVFRSLPASPRLALLETPAGFELNSPRVIGRVADFFSHRLQNYAPRVEIIPARKRGTPFSPDEPEVVAPLLESDLIFMGPGSPSYAVRQLQSSLAWYYLIARHRLGAALALASAATIAFSARALPVYEIYKAGEELHWLDGLDFFKFYGLQLVFIPHWNNQEGGADLDTSRCFMGQTRFSSLMEMLPDDMTIIGIDEKTALIMDIAKCVCQVKGLGGTTLIHTGHQHLNSEGRHSFAHPVDYVTGTNINLDKVAEGRTGHVHYFESGQVFPLSQIGPFHPYYPETSLPPGIWQKAIMAANLVEVEIELTLPKEVEKLIQQRCQARQVGDWTTADKLRAQVVDLGWEIIDSKDGSLGRKIHKI